MTHDHAKAKEFAEFVLSGYDPGSEYDLAQAYLDLTAKVELLTEALEFYKRDKYKNFVQWINHVEYDWGQIALTALAKYKEGIDKDGK